VWTRQAEESFNRVIDYLLDAWTSREAHNFIVLVEETIHQIKGNPELFKASVFDEETQEAVITKQTSMFYRIKNKDIIEIEYFWNNYRNPKYLKSSLKE